MVWLEWLHGSIARLASMVEAVPAGESAVRVLAQGRIASGSVHLSGLRLRFVENGRRRSVRLKTG